MRGLICLLTVIFLGVQQTTGCCVASGSVGMSCRRPLGMECEHTHCPSSQQAGQNHFDSNPACPHHADHAGDETPGSCEPVTPPNPFAPSHHEQHLCVGTHVFYVPDKLVELPQPDLAPLFVSLEFAAVVPVSAVGESSPEYSHGPPLLLNRSVLGIYLL